MTTASALPTGQWPRLRRVVAAGVGSAVVLAAVSGTLRPMPVSASPIGGTVTVSTTTDVSDGVTTSIAALIASPGADNRISLREAIAAANNTPGADTVNVPPGTYNLAHGDLKVGTSASSNISIVGIGNAAGTVINGDGTNRVLTLDPNLAGNVTVAISNVTITGGHDQDGFGGAGIIGGNPSPPDTTTLSNCVVSGNQTTTTATNSPGGGIQYIGGSLSVTNCTISGNSSKSSPGGGIDFETLTPHPGSFTLTNSTVSGNTLTNSDPAAFVGGAGVHVQAMTGSTVTMTGDTFTNNVATGSSSGPVGGGGLWLEGPATVTSATFTGNQANGPASTLAGGGAVNLGTGSSTLAFSRITGNTASHGAGGVENNGAEAVTTATDNWWGCNAGPGNSGCDATANSGSGTGSLTVNPRLVLAVTAAPTKLIAGLGQTSAVTASLTHDSSTPSVDTSGSGHVPDGIGVSYSGVLGAVLPPAGTLSGGTASTTFTGGTVPGAGSASATVDNQTVAASIGIGVPPHIGSANTATFSSGSLNTFQVTATGTPAPTYSETGALPGGVTLNSVTGALTGTPAHGSSEGPYPITLKAANGYGTDDTQSFTVTVVQAPVITSANSFSFTEGTAGSFTVVGTGIPAPTFTELGVLPPGITLDSATGVLAGTPGPDSHGTYLLTLTAHNTGSPDATQGFTLTVGLPPAITSGNSTTLTVGTAGSFQVTATGYPAPTFGVTGGLPSGVTLDPTTGVLGGTPDAHTGGPYSITVTASNGFGTTATQSFTLTVDEAPAITSGNATTFTAGVSGGFAVTGTGYPNPSFSESGALPSGVGLDPTTGLLSGTPAALTGGAYAITVTVSNGVSPDATQGFILTVDEAPAITSGGGTTFVVGQSGTFAVSATGYPTPSYSESGALPSGVGLDTVTGVLSGTPGVGTAGAYPITLTAHSAGEPDATQSFTVTVKLPTQAPAITSATSTGFTEGAAGSFTVTATGLPAPGYGESGVLPPGVSFDDTTGVLTGTPGPGSNGTYLLTLTASNGVAPDATQGFTLTVGLPPVITSGSGTTFTVGTAGTFAVTATGFPAPSFSETGGLPSGVTLDSTTGELSGTPAAHTGGAYSITVTASNGFGTDATQTFTLTVDEAPAITSATGSTFTAGSAATFTVTATGYPAPSFSETGALPSGVSLDPTTGVLSGTPAALTGGGHGIIVTASNGVSPVATQGFTLIVDEAAAITSGTGATLTAGSAGSFTVTATGYPAPSFSETGALPSGVSLDPTTGVLSGTPAALTGGTYDLTISAHNGIGSDAQQAFILTVDEAPAFTSADGTTFTVGAAGTFTVAATGTPAPTLHESGSLPAGVTFDAGTGVLSGTPSPSAGGTYDLTLTASNHIGTAATQQFTLTVDETPAITSAGSTSFVEGHSGSFTMTVGGFPTPTLGESGALPAGVTFDSATGVLSGTPGVGTAAVYPVTLTAQNGVLPDASQSFTLNVGLAPVITSPNSATFTVGTPDTQTVTATGFPTPTLGIVGSLPTGVTFDTSTGTLSGTPAAGTGGVDTVTLTASNGVQPDATQTFTLHVDEAPAITSGLSATFTTGVAGSQQVVATGSPTPDLSEAGALPAGVGFDPTTGLLSGTPAADAGGTYSLTFTASNLIGHDYIQHFTLTVDQPPAISGGAGAIFIAGTPGTFTVTVTGFPAPTLSPSPTLPTGLTLDPSSGVLSGTAAAGTGNSYPLTLTASNGVGNAATEAFTLTVDEAPVIISANTTTVTTGSATPFTVLATGYPIPTLSEAGALPSGVTFDPSSGLLTGAPLAGNAGDYPISFTADNGVGSGTTQSFTLTVLNATTTTVVSSNLRSISGQPVTLTATVASGAATPPTGKVLFIDGALPLGGGNLAVVNGVATVTFTTSGLGVGSHTISATYGGDGVNSSSSSPNLTQVVTTVALVTVTPHSHTLRANGSAHTSVTALVTDAGGQPVAGDTVTFTSTPNGGVTFSPVSATTGPDGIATTTATAGRTAEQVTLTGTEGFGGTNGTATEKLLGVKFSTKAIVSSRIAANGTSTAVAAVTVVDGNGSPVGGETVTFQNGGRSTDATLAQPSVVTDSGGVASDTVTSSTTPGTEAITVSDSNADPADNFATVLALTQLPAVGPTNASFIHNAYVTLLGRDADPAGFAYWLDRLDHGTPRTVLTQALASTPEYRSDVIGGTITVPGLYQQYLGRPSDPGGLLFWLGYMAFGHSFEQVRIGFLGSSEYPAHHGNDPSATVEALFEDVLGRPSDPTGKAYWLANYNATTIATQFIQSPEGRAHLVTVLYGAILDRTPDSAGLSYWTQQLLNGAPDEFVIGALLGSDEYFLSH